MPGQSTSPSFIPREVPQMGEAKPVRGNALSDLLSLISIVLLVASVALAVGVFLYQQYLHTSSTSKVDQLERAKAAFEPQLIQELTRLDDRMRATGQILNTHVAPSALFSMLESSTITTVSFRSLDFEANQEQHMTITMTGVADSVNSIALQADVFAKGGMLTSPIFSDIDREQDGVHFNLSGLVNPSSVNFVQLAQSAQAAASQALPAQVTNSPFGPTGATQGSVQGGAAQGTQGSQ